ncbi:MAG: hypothetical protein HY519_02570 [Candidatus Aenigmarchaeota archaeon]|nr:hypothetical protein [Candidatus Aenigmarchaeota archaeon]
MQMQAVNAAYPAMALAAVLPVLAFVAAMALPSVGTALMASGLTVGTPVILLIGWWAGVLARKAKGGHLEAGIAGLGVGIAHAILAVVLFGLVAGGSIAQLVDGNVIYTLVAIGSGVAGGGIMSGGQK